MKVGFIGLGIMGKPMAINLIKKGYKTYILDINKEIVNELSLRGGIPCKTSKEVAHRSDIVMMMLPTTKEIKNVLFGESGIVKSNKNNLIVADMSSISPSDTQIIYEKMKSYNMEYIDAPVSGGEPMAKDGTLTIMVGGSERVFDKTESLFKAMGKEVIHVGDSGAGSTVKLANQIIVNSNIAALSEAAVLASKSGVDLSKMYQAIRSGLAGSQVMEAKMPKIINRDFDPGGRIDINFKDLNNILSFAYESGVPLPITSQVREIFHSQMVNNFNDRDHCHIVDYFEKLSNHKIPQGGKN